MRAPVALMCLVAIAGCNQQKPQATAEDAAATEAVTAPAPAPAPPESPIERIQKAPSLASALAIAAPHFEDRPNEMGRGTLMLIAWAAQSMKWADVGASEDETSYALVMKDAEEERGKRLCATGNIIQIAVEKTDFGKVHLGLLMTGAGNIFRFYGVGSSGTLVERNRARFCGVVTGRYSYSNSGGGTGHAVKFVGMFDLPANRTTAGTEQAAPVAKAAAAAAAADAPAGNVGRMKQCCSALSGEAKRMGDAAEAGMFTSAAAQCSSMAAQAGPTGVVPEVGAIRAMLAGRNVPAVCAGF